MKKKSRPPEKLGVSASSRESKNEDGRPALVPKLRFPEFEGETLHKVQLGDVTEESVSRNGHKYTVSSVMGVTKAEGIVPMEARLIASDIARYKLVQKNWFAYNPMRLNIGSIARWKGESEILVSPDYVVFKCMTEVKPGIDPVYLDHFRQTKAWEEFVTEGGDGSVRVRIYYKDIARVQLALPSPAEQQKIASCLSSVDELMAAQARKVDALKTHKKGLMQQLFPREGETQPRLRFPEFQNAGDWESTTVGGLVESGCLFPPKDGNHGNIHPKSSDYVASGIPFIMASDLNGGLIDIENCHYISKEQADTLQKGFAKEGDVLLSHKGTVGEVAVVRKINTPYLMLTPQVTHYRVKDPKRLSNEFLAQLFVSGPFQSNLVEVSGGGTRAYIGITQQAKLRLQLPDDFEEQHCIATCLSSLDALITAETQKHAALQRHKRGLMQQLFPSMEQS